MVLRRLLLASAIAVLPSAGLAATFTVNTTADLADTTPGDGLCRTSALTCSLRAAIQEANATAAADLIAFNIPGAGVQTIRPASALPVVTQPVVIDGYTQPGAQPNTNPTGALNTVLRVEIDFSQSQGMDVVAGDTTVRGLVLNGAAVSVALHFQARPNNVVEGCFIGTDPAGTTARRNLYGIALAWDTSGNRIGGAVPAARNLISGNSDGIWLQCPLPATSSCHAGTTILGNLIGTDATGTAAFTFQVRGIFAEQPAGLVIGGPAPGEGNVISGTSHGIYMHGATIHHATIAGNIIGGTVGLQPLGNSQSGLDLRGGCNGCGGATYVVGGSPASGNWIGHNMWGIFVEGANLQASHNVVRESTRSGIEFRTFAQAPSAGTVTDNLIEANRVAGLVTDGASITAARNRFVGNGTIFGGADAIEIRRATDRVVLTENTFAGNVGLAIDLGSDGVTPNDPGDTDTGPNGFQNYPLVDFACLGGSALSVGGSLHSSPGASHVIELFTSPACDASGHGEGDRFEGAVTVTTGADGNAAFTDTFASGAAVGDRVTATATGADGTSEFGACVTVIAAGPPPAQGITGPASVCAASPFALTGVPGAASYQWFLDGTPIAGETGVTLQRASATAGDGGTYTVRASRCGADAVSPGHALSVVACPFAPVRLDVDSHPGAGTASDGNGVVEPSESVLIEPRHRNDAAIAAPLAGTASIGGPAGGFYALPDSAASYGSVPPGQLTDCFGATGDCYRATVAPAPVRPTMHWDAFFDEDPTGSTPSRRWPLHIGDTFADVKRADNYYRFVEALIHNGVTGGCSASGYCPAAPATREQMAVFVLVAKEGPAYRPPDCNPVAPRFTDVPASSGFCPWVEELARRQVVSGCGGSSYCPAANVFREQMAVFVLATREAPGYAPPACVAGAERFADVPASSGFCAWIEELARRGVVSGCGNGNFCPASAITRGEMSVFLTVAFGLLLYGP